MINLKRTSVLAILALSFISTSAFGIEIGRAWNSPSLIPGTPNVSSFSAPGNSLNFIFTVIDELPGHGWTGCNGDIINQDGQTKHFDTGILKGLRSSANIPIMNEFIQGAPYQMKWRCNAYTPGMDKALVKVDVLKIEESH